MKTAIMKWGDSQGVMLPKHVLESADIAEDDLLELITDNHSIIITKINRPLRKSIQERFAGFTGTYEEKPVDWGQPVGKEIW